MVEMVFALNVERKINNMNTQLKGTMLLVVDDNISDISEISSKEYNKEITNSISKRYPKLRQQSKAP